MSNKNEFQAPLYATNELLIAIGASEKIAERYQARDKDSVSFVQNTENQVALALPYYAYVDSAPSSAALSEDELEDVAGGFFPFFPVENMYNLHNGDAIIEILQRGNAPQERIDRFKKNKAICDANHRYPGWSFGPEFWAADNPSSWL